MPKERTAGCFIINEQPHSFTYKCLNIQNMKKHQTYEGDRVRANTANEINSRIDQHIKDKITSLKDADRTIIAKRIKRLNNEWDIERVLELNASLLAFTGVALASTINKKWLILPAVVTAFLAQHAIQGWCPPLPVLRALGVRTQREIEHEKQQLADQL